MTKTPQQLLKAYKKANKEARKKILAKVGFDDEVSYIDYLNNCIAGKIVGPLKDGETTKTDQLVDVVFAFDTTGSMAEYIQSVKRHVQTTIPQMFENTPNLVMGVVAFGDYCDMKNANDFGLAYQRSNFTNNQQHLIDFVNKAKSTGGGDADEFYELVIKKITEETPWREGSKRLVIFIADCNPHEIGYRHPYIPNGGINKIDWRVEAKKAADKGIQFDTFTISAHHQGQWMKELSKITNGVSLPFQSAHKTEEVLRAATYARGGEKSKVAFDAMFTAAVKRGDDELVGVYKSLSSKF